MNLTKCWFYTGSFNNGSDGNVQATYNFSIDWGDGSAIDYYSNADAQGGYLPVRHTYDKKGVYVASLTGTCDNLYQTGGVDYKNNIVSLKDCLWGIVVPKNSESPLKYAHASFFGCESLRYLGKHIFDNLTECKMIAHLFDGSSITRFPKNMFAKLSNLENVEYALEATQIEQLPPDLFSCCTEITNAAHVCHRCNKLLQIPQEFFKNNTKIANLNMAFKSCTSLVKVPKNLFDNCPDIQNCSWCFSGGRTSNDFGYNKYMVINTELPPLWDSSKWSKITQHTGYARGCTSAQNYKTAINAGTSWV